MSERWSILYAKDDEIYRVGPFPTEPAAMDWARKNDYSNQECGGFSEFDITETHVYLLGSEHQIQELSIEDLSLNTEVQSGN